MGQWCLPRGHRCHQPGCLVGCDLVSLFAKNWSQVLAFSTIEMLLCVLLGLGVGKNWWGQLLKAVAVSFFVTQLWTVVPLLLPSSRGLQNEVWARGVSRGVAGGTDLAVCFGVTWSFLAENQCHQNQHNTVAILKGCWPLKTNTFCVQLSQQRQSGWN